VRSSLVRFAWLSVAAGVSTVALKGVAAWLTDSVALFSDALESFVNVAAAVVTLAMLAVAARPPDDEHAYGHDKAEYFASGVEGGLILVAAISIVISAGLRLAQPRPLEHLGAGLILGGVASLINLAVASVLLRVGRLERSIALEADARHLMVDVFTTGGVFLGMGAARLTGWSWLDPATALLVGAHILGTGAGLLRRSVLGLMDTALPAPQMKALLDILKGSGVPYHALRTRMSGQRSFASVHILVPGQWTVQQGHELLERIEQAMREAVPGLVVVTHLEPAEDPASFLDQTLERSQEARK
jgi:cation diffusion facilitator family transporter